MPPAPQAARALLPLLWVACTIGAAFAQTTSYVNPWFGFEVEHPTGWEVEVYGPMLEFAEFRGGRAIVLTEAYEVDPAHRPDPGEVLQRAADALRYRIYEVEASEAMAVTLRRMPAWVTHYTGLAWLDDELYDEEGGGHDDGAELDEDLPVTGSLYVFLSRSVLLIVTVEAPSSDYEAYLPLFEAMLDSVALRF